MVNNQTDLDWEFFGKVDPYWAVYSHDKFKRESLDDQNIKDFFDSGTEYVETTFEKVRKSVNPKFAPKRAFDFGCGVGRLALPLARVCDFVTGVDVSEHMLAEAQENAKRFGLRNVEFLKSDDTLSRVRGQYDFVNTYIVLQHIPTSRGIVIYRRMVELLKDGGVGVIHVTYGTAGMNPMTNSAWGVNPSPIWNIIPKNTGFATRIRRLSLGTGLMSKLRRKPTAAPVAAAAPAPAPAEKPTMQMNPYAINALLHIIQSAGVSNVSMEFTDHAGFYGVTLMFQKPVSR